jgi:hypothetical protein
MMVYAQEGGHQHLEENFLLSLSSREEEIASGVERNGNAKT